MSVLERPISEARTELSDLSNVSICDGDTMAQAL